MQYSVIPLGALIKSWEPQEVQRFLDSFKCSRDTDLEDFLKRRAVIFEKMDRSRTYIFVDEFKILGYVSLATTIFSIEKSNRISKNIIKKMHLENNSTTAFLIGQLGKDDSVKDKMGKIMIDFAKYMFSKNRTISGGRIVCIDCKEALLQYYEQLDFKAVNFDEETGLYRMIWFFGSCRFSEYRSW